MVFLIQHNTGFLDTFYSLFRMKGDGQSFLVVLDAVGVVIGIKFEFRSVFVTFIIVGIIDSHRVLLVFKTVVSYVVVPCNVLLIGKLTHFAHCPDGAFCLVYTDNIDRIGEL